MALRYVKTASLLSTFGPTARTPERTLWFGRRHRHRRLHPQPTEVLHLQGEALKQLQSWWKVKFFLYTTWRHMDQFRHNSIHSWPWHQMDLGDQFHVPEALSAVERAPGTHWIRIWKGPEPGCTPWGAVDLLPCRKSKHDCLVVQAVA